MKDSDVQPDEEVHRVRSERVLSAGASVAMELGYPTFLAYNVFTSPEFHQSCSRIFTEFNLQHLPKDWWMGLNIPTL